MRCATAICYIRKWNVACNLVILFTRCKGFGCNFQCTYIGIAHRNRTEWVWNLIVCDIAYTSASHTHEIPPCEHPHWHQHNLAEISWKTQMASDTIEAVDIFPQSPISIIVLHTNAIFGIFFIDSFVDKYKFRTISYLVLHRAVDLTHQYQTQVNCAIIAQYNSFLQQTSSKSFLRKYRHSVKRKTWKIVWNINVSKFRIWSLLSSHTCNSLNYLDCRPVAWTISYIRVFSKCARMAIMPILASEA